MYLQHTVIVQAHFVPYRNWCGLELLLNIMIHSWMLLLTICAPTGLDTQGKCPYHLH